MAQGNRFGVQRRHKVKALRQGLFNRNHSYAS
jgi:hypothetical protein